MQKRWKLLSQAPKEQVAQLSHELNNLPSSLSQILIQRGVDTFEKSKTFFRPNWQYTHDPVLMMDMQKAVDRIHKAITQGEHILI